MGSQEATSLLSFSIDPFTPENIYAADTDIGFYKSLNGGEIWELIGNGLPRNQGGGVTSIVFTKDEVFVTDSGLIYRSQKNSISWERLIPDTGLPKFALVLIDSIDNKLYACSGVNPFLGALGGKGLFRRDIITSVSHSENKNVLGFKLNANYPNPFNAGTKISFEISKRALVNLEIYDILGEKVTTLINREMIQDLHEIHWNAKGETGIDLPSGVYFYQLKVDNFFETKKMILLR